MSSLYGRGGTHTESTKALSKLDFKNTWSLSCLRSKCHRVSLESGLLGVTWEQHVIEILLVPSLTD